MTVFGVNRFVSLVSYLSSGCVGVGVGGEGGGEVKRRPPSLRGLLRLGRAASSPTHHTQLLTHQDRDLLSTRDVYIVPACLSAWLLRNGSCTAREQATTKISTKFSWWKHNLCYSIIAHTTVLERHLQEFGLWQPADNRSDMIKKAEYDQAVVFLFFFFFSFSLPLLSERTPL